MLGRVSCALYIQRNKHAAHSPKPSGCAIRFTKLKDIATHNRDAETGFTEFALQRCHALHSSRPASSSGLASSTASSERALRRRHASMLLHLRAALELVALKGKIRAS